MLHKLLRARTAATVVVALMAASGIAVAATSTGSRPTFAQEETSTSEADSTTTSVADSTTTSSTSEVTTTTAAPSTSTTAGPGEFKNHGACVSAAAHDTPPGPGHGRAVSEVAKSDCGKDKAAGDGDEQQSPEATEPEGSSHGNSQGKGQGHNK